MNPVNGFSRDNRVEEGGFEVKTFRESMQLHWNFQQTVKKGGMDTFWDKIIQTIILNYTAESVLTSAE